MYKKLRLLIVSLIICICTYMSAINTYADGDFNGTGVNGALPTAPIAVAFG